MYCYLTFCVGHTSIGPYFRSSGQMWKMSTITFIADVSSGASIWHVALIVLLRCFSIAKPMSFTTWHKKFSKICIYGIWIFMVTIVLIPTLICTKFFTTSEFPEDYLTMYGGAWDAVQHITFTLPIALILVFYLFQLYYLKPCGQKEEQSDATMSKKKSIERTIHMLAVGTLVCYVPYAAWMQYNILMISQNRAEEVFDTTGKVSTEHLF